MSYVSDLTDGPGSSGIRRDTGPAGGDFIGTDLVADGVIDTAPTAGVQFLTDGVRPGDTAEVRLNTAANNGFYLILEVPTETLLIVNNVFTPVADPNDRVRIFQDGKSVLAPTPITAAFAADDRITVAGAGFLTSVTLGDVVYIDQDTNNNGQYVISRVETDAIIHVKTLDEGAVVFTAGAATGRVTVSRTSIRLTVTDEATPTFAAVSAGHPVLCKARNPTAAMTFYYPKFTEIIIHRTAGINETHWKIENETIILDVEGFGFGEWFPSANDQGNNLIKVDIGTPGTDRYAANNSSAVLGYTFEQFGSGPGMQVNTHGSAISTLFDGGGNFHQFAPTGETFSSSASLIIGDIFYIDGPTAAVVESLNVVAEQNAIVLTADQDMQNILMAGQGASSAITAGANAVIRSFLKSADISAPAFTLLGASDLDIIDSREDYTLAELFSVASGAGRTLYTYNPRFVDRAGAVIVGAKVRIRLFNGLTDLGDIVGSPFTTTAAGRINVDLGVELLKFTSTSPASTFSHLVEVNNGVSGANYSPFAKFIIMRSPLDIDEVVDWEQVDFEGEYRGGV